MRYYGFVSQSRNYDDPCGTARALSVIGDKWALLVVRELIFGPKRFTDLSSGLPTISQNVLSQRLRDLERSEVVRRRKLGPPASISVYELTERGRALEPVLIALGQWGSRIPLDAKSTSELSIDALILALKTTFDPTIADDLDATYQLRLDNDRFHAEIANGQFAVMRGEIHSADATIEATPAALRALVFGRQPLSDDIATISGNVDAAARFLRCFPRPSPFPPANADMS